MTDPTTREEAIRARATRAERDAAFAAYDADLAAAWAALRSEMARITASIPRRPTMPDLTTRLEAIRAAQTDYFESIKDAVVSIAAKPTPAFAMAYRAYHEALARIDREYPEEGT